MCNYRKASLFKPISNQLNFLVICNLGITRSLNVSYLLNRQRICHLFSIFNFTCCKCVALKENNLTHSCQSYYSKHTKHTPQGCPYRRDQGFPLREERWQSWGGGGIGAAVVSALHPKILNLSYLSYLAIKKISPPISPLIIDQILEN